MNAIRNDDYATAEARGPYRFLPLLLAVFSEFVRRSEVLLREKLAKAFENTVQQTHNVTSIDDTNSEILIVYFLAQVIEN